MEYLGYKVVLAYSHSLLNLGFVLGQSRPSLEFEPIPPDLLVVHGLGVGDVDHPINYLRVWLYLKSYSIKIFLRLGLALAAAALLYGLLFDTEKVEQDVIVFGLALQYFDNLGNILN